MSLPTPWTIIEIYGQSVDKQGNPNTGTITFVMLQPLVVDSIEVTQANLIAVLDDTGSFTVQLPATDDPNVAPQGAAYMVYEQYATGLARPPYAIPVTYTAAGGRLNLFEIAPLVPPPDLVSTIGPRGYSLYTGTGAPSNGIGNDGDTYIDAPGGVVYGPKAGGVWPTPGTVINQAQAQAYAAAALASAQAAAASASSAAGSATTATTQAGIATGAATTATTQAGIATTEADAAQGFASTASTQAAIATTQAGNASSSAAAAATSATASAASVGQLTTELASNAAGMGAALVAYLTGTVKSFLDSLTTTGSTVGAALIGFIAAGSGAVARWVQDKLREIPSIVDYGGDPTGATDSSAAFAAAKAANNRIFLPPGLFYINTPQVLSEPVEIYGSGRGVSYLVFNNAVPNAAFITFARGSLKSKFSGFTIIDRNFGTSTGLVFSDIATGASPAVAKNKFYDVEVTGFALGHTYTSPNPLSGTTHGNCSENTWTGCRFTNNVLTCLNQNIQAVNNNYENTDFENFDTTDIFGTVIVDSDFTFFNDQAGGSIHLKGGSIVGRGELYTWAYPAGGTGLWQGATFGVQGARMEARATYNGVIFKEAVSGNTGSLVLSIDVHNFDVDCFGAAIDLLEYGGRVNANFDRVKVMAGYGSLTIRQYPTIGRTTGTTTGSQGSVGARSCEGLYFTKATASPYGTYNSNYTGRVSLVDSHSGGTGQSFVTDAYGWQSLSNNGGDLRQMGLNLGNCPAFSRLVYNSDTVGSGLAGNLSIVMPPGGRPIKFIAYKHPQQFAVDVGYNLYIAKDEANWVTPGTFAYTTDAVLVATLPATTNLAGYFEIPVQLPSNVFGTYLQAGQASWTEGRLFLLKRGSANPFPGFVGVEYA